MHALLRKHLFFEDTLALGSFLVEKRFDANAACFGTKVAAQSVGSGEAPSAAPGTAVGELASTDEFLLSRVQPFVALAVVLPGESFTADCADEGSLVGVGTEM